MPWQCSACSAHNPDGNAFCGQCGAAGATSLKSERRLVTALFADISGFSELSARIDAEELVELIDPVVTALSNVVGRFGGTVEKYAGDAILALFGAPVAHDDDAARALRTADAMHRELAALVPELGPDGAGLKLHVGVNSGHGIGRVMGSDVRLDYGVLGDVVVLAQRLEAAAPPGETYVGEATYELTRKQFELEPLGELTVKGKTEPIHAWRLVANHEGGAASHRSAPVTTLAGRENELAALGALIDGLAEGRGGAGFVAGEAGAGKTMLCAAIRVRAESARLDWLAARCISYGGELAYWPFADLLRRLFGIVDAPQSEAIGRLEEQLAELALQDALPFVAALCGVEGAPATELGAQSFQIRLHESVVAVLRALAERAPTILHLDDLHWADGPTVELLRKVLRLGSELPLLVIVSTRPEALSLVAELERIPGECTHIELEPLADAAVRQIATGILGAPPSTSLAAELLERTRGNPFFVEEVARSLRERDELIERNGEWHLRPDWEGGQVPLTVEGILAARVDGLDEPQRDALEVLSIIGRRADGELARAVSREIDAAVPALVGAGMLEPPVGPSYVLAFHHPLIQQVVYARLLRRRRARLHTLVAEAAGRLYGVDDASIDLFARHFYLGEEPRKAYPYLLRAADRAERLYANEQALTQLRRALELTDVVAEADGDKLDLLLRCARLEKTVGRFEEARALYHDVSATGHFRSAVEEAEVLRLLGRSEEAEACLEQARRLAADPSPADAAALALGEGLVLRQRGELDSAVETFERGLAAASGHDVGLEGELLLELGYVLGFMGRREEGFRQARRARLIFERAGDLPRLALTLRVLGGIECDLADAKGDRDGLRRSRRTLEQARELARRIGDAEQQAGALINLAVVSGYLGEYETALEADYEALAAFESAGLRNGVACASCNIADHLVELGRYEEALDEGRRGLAVAEEVEMPYWITGALASIAMAELALGNPQASLAAAERSVEEALAHGLHDRARWALRHAGNAHEALGNDERAEELRRRSDQLAESP